MFDTMIIGAGVTGMAIAHFLSKTELSVLAVEAKEDVAEGATKANSAIVHAGYDAKPGTLKAKYNVEGNRMYPALAKQLGFPFINNGSLILCFKEEDRPELEALYQRGIQNGVEKLEILTREQVLEMEPHVNPEVVGALYAPTGGITCPYEACIALSESAKQNGVKFLFESPVTKIEKIEGGFRVTAGEKTVETKTIVNAAGLYADEIARMAGGIERTIKPRKGEYMLFDKAAGHLAARTLFQLPTKMGKGVLVTPTVDGNLLMGPTAEDIEDKADTATTAEGLDDVLDAAALTLPQIPRRQLITQLSGLRAHDLAGDFFVGEDPKVKGMYHALGIESPGLTAAPAVGQALAKQIQKDLQAAEKKDWIAERKPIARFSHMTDEQRAEAAEENPAYGKIICRCETVTQAEVEQAIDRTIGRVTIDGIKRRTRCGMGRCQGGFCMMRVAEIIHKKTGMPMEEITKKGEGSALCVKEETPCR